MKCTEQNNETSLYLINFMPNAYKSLSWIDV
jgi:hypothetical protein